MLTAEVFNIQRYSVNDGPGIRTSVFLAGCPLNCTWCHNPEGMDSVQRISHVAGRCIVCRECVTVCPQQLAGPLTAATLVPESGGVCIACGACADTCPTEARSLVGTNYAVADLVRELEKDRIFYEESGGGVTFSGGDPLAQVNADFLLECLIACREARLHCTVDTSGFAPLAVLQEVACYTDLFLYDLKLMDDQEHRLQVGVGNELILNNLRTLSRSGQEIWIRVPLIPGITDVPANLDAIAEFVVSLPVKHPVHLLPYHETAGDKYRRLGLKYELEGIGSMAAAEVAAQAERLRARGLEVHIGG